MSGNLIRTILNIAAIAVMVASSLLGCTTALDGTTTCTASWLTPQLAAIAASVFVVLNLAIKALGQGGSVVQNLGNKAVVVVAASDPMSGPGNVTPADVAKK